MEAGNLDAGGLAALARAVEQCGRSYLPRRIRVLDLHPTDSQASLLRHQE
jgi:hypothetical protein